MSARSSDLLGVLLLGVLLLEVGVLLRDFHLLLGIFLHRGDGSKVFGNEELKIVDGSKMFDVLLLMVDEVSLILLDETVMIKTIIKTCVSIDL